MSLILKFNTGRKYTEYGQRITAFVHDDGTVDFNDHDRQIYGRLTDRLPTIVPGDDEILWRWIVDRYDVGKYTDLPREARDAVKHNHVAVYSLLRR